jgi:glyoxylase-like metal-dependent hydrolase (beta-lactamase superfamily II)
MQDFNIHIVKTPLDFPPYYTNSYLIKTKDGLFLFDTSIKSTKAIEIIKESINNFGRIDGIILSHGHLDHAGCASIIANEYNIPIYVSLEEKDRLGTNFNERLKRRLDKLTKIANFFRLEKKNIEREYEKASYYKNLLAPIDFYFNIEKLNLAEIDK